MAGLNKESLIEMLILEPTNDKEIGYNIAIIAILKKIVSLAGGSGETVDINSLNSSLQGFGLSNAEKAIRNAIRNSPSVKVENSIMSCFTNTEMEEIVSFVLNGQKLQAIKSFKDKTLMGLKECKDIIDLIK